MSDGTTWRIVVTPTAEKDLGKVPVRDRGRIRAAIDALTCDPRQGDLKKLQGRVDEWRLRVGDWRVRLRTDNRARVIVILRVLPREQANRD